MFKWVIGSVSICLMIGVSNSEGNAVSSNELISLKAAVPYIPCIKNPGEYKRRARELQQIRDEDQAARLNLPMRKDEAFQDLKRRQRVAEIFAEGCFKEASDYAAAALVFQHGDHPDHFFQAFIWSMRAVALGDSSQKKLMANSLDRYLLHIGHKQLFASQALILPNDPCACLQPVEPTFPDKMRLQYTGKSMKQALEWVDSLNANHACQSARQCDVTLKATPPKTIPGFW